MFFQKIENSQYKILYKISLSDSKITREIADVTVDDVVKSDQISYIPRVSSSQTGKRGAILTWALPNNRM